MNLEDLTIINEIEHTQRDIYDNLIGKNPDLFADFILSAIASEQLSTRKDYYFSSYWRDYGNAKFKRPEDVLDHSKNKDKKVNSLFLCVQLENVIIESFSDIWVYRHGDNIGFHNEAGKFVRLICAYDYYDNNLNHGGGRTTGFSFPIDGFIGIPKTLEEYETYSKLIRI